MTRGGSWKQSTSVLARLWALILLLHGARYNSRPSARQWFEECWIYGARARNMTRGGRMRCSDQTGWRSVAGVPLQADYGASANVQYACAWRSCIRRMCVSVSPSVDIGCPYGQCCVATRSVLLADTSGPLVGNSCNGKTTYLAMLLTRLPHLSYCMMRRRKGRDLAERVLGTTRALLRVESDVQTAVGEL